MKNAELRTDDQCTQLKGISPLPSLRAHEAIQNFVRKFGGMPRKDMMCLPCNHFSPTPRLSVNDETGVAENWIASCARNDKALGSVLKLLALDGRRFTVSRERTEAGKIIL